MLYSLPNFGCTMGIVYLGAGLWNVFLLCLQHRALPTGHFSSVRIKSGIVLPSVYDYVNLAGLYGYMRLACLKSLDRIIRTAVRGFERASGIYRHALRNS